MIVKCIAIYNDHTKKILDRNTNNCITKGWHYNVLEIMFPSRGVSYRVIADDEGVRGCGIIVRAQDFEIVSSKLPESWVKTNIDDKYSDLSPASWANMSIWEESFFQDYCENKPKAIKCFIEETAEIIRLDKEYIQTMIDERAKNPMTERWNRSMKEVFNKIAQTDSRMELKFTDADIEEVLKVE